MRWIKGCWFILFNINIYIIIDNFNFRYMGIGLSASGVNMNRLPGWDKHSYGYHGDDGHSFCSSGTGQPYGPTFTTGDFIGCGINLVDNTCFYTKNGHHLGIAFTDLPVRILTLIQPILIRIEIPIPTVLMIFRCFLLCELSPICIQRWDCRRPEKLWMRILAKCLLSLTYRTWWRNFEQGQRGL